MIRQFCFFLFCLSLFTVALGAQSQPQVYITGTVAMADGTPLPAAVEVHLKCHGSVLQSVYVSPGDGRFSFSVNQRTESAGPGSDRRSGRGMDASIGGPTISPDLDRRTQAGNIAFRRTDLSHCQCEAALAGYRSEVVRLGVRSQFDDPDIGFINMYPLHHVQGITISVTTATAPKKAMEAFQKAKEELSEGKADHSEVIRHLEDATEIYPEFAEAWQFLAEAYLSEGRQPESREAFRKALEADPLYLPPYGSLAELELRDNHIEEAARLTVRALELNPYDMTNQYIHAIAQYYLGHLDQASESLHVIHASNDSDRFPASHRLLGSIYSEQKDYTAAAEEFQHFLATDPPAEEAREVKDLLEEWQRAGLLPSPESEQIESP